MSKYTPQQEKELMKTIWTPDIAQDPYNYVMFAFPWGKRGTPLEHHSGPRQWQAELLKRTGEHYRNNLAHYPDKPQLYNPFNSCTSSGRGIGKSAIVAWLSLWMMSTQRGSSTVLTANTETQLKTKTFAEIGRWHALAINSHWFEKQSLAILPAEWYATLLEEQLSISRTYHYAQGVTWTEDNPDAFAGSHNMYGFMLLMDEASGVPQSIFNVSKGFFTELTPNRFWFCFSNPRRNTGAFYEAFHSERDFWTHLQYIDARKVEGSDTRVLQAIVDKYGIDSDVSRTEVLGQFPKQSDSQFISRDIVEAAELRELNQPEHNEPLIMGIDPARKGTDSSAIVFRRGRDARSIPIESHKGLDNMELANVCAELINRYNPDAVCIDAGNGTGIIDRLRERNYKVHEVWFGAKASAPHASPDVPTQRFGNKRAEMWALMKAWMENGGCIPQDNDLHQDLVTPEFHYPDTSDHLYLESKESIRKRGFPSPDKADALACTFSIPVAKLKTRTRLLQQQGLQSRQSVAEGTSEGYFKYNE
jgi:hypothetical protein